MCPPYTLVARTRQSILGAYADALRAWADGESIDAVELHRHVDSILLDLVGRVQSAAEHKGTLQDEFDFD